MMIDQSKSKFADLLREIEASMGTEIQEVHVWRERNPATFNGKPYEKSEKGNNVICIKVLIFS